MLKLTVITATYNVVKAGRAEMLKRCITSVAKLNTPHEHLIMDGASTDGTVDILKSMERENDGVRVVSEPDTGLYNALNKGVRIANGKWIYVLGCDDYVFAPKVMDEVMEEADKTDADMVLSPVHRSDNIQPFRSFEDFRCILTIMPYSHQGVLMTRMLVDRVGGFNEDFKICADFALCLNAHMADAKQLIIWKEYAYFEAGGMSTYSEKAHHDWVHVTACALGLNDREEELLYRKKLLPIRKVLPLLRHPSPVIRIGARHALKRHVANVLGMIGDDGQPRKWFRKF